MKKMQDTTVTMTERLVDAQSRIDELMENADIVEYAKLLTIGVMLADVIADIAIIEGFNIYNFNNLFEKYGI